jgi:hypothetical protein
MNGEAGERWRALCEQAAVEQDPDRLLQLILEITHLLEIKEQRLKLEREAQAKSASGTSASWQRDISS